MKAPTMDDAERTPFAWGGLTVVLAVLGSITAVFGRHMGLPLQIESWLAWGFLAGAAISFVAMLLFSRPKDAGETKI